MPHPVSPSIKILNYWGIINSYWYIIIILSSTFILIFLFVAYYPFFCSGIPFRIPTYLYSSCLLRQFLVLTNFLWLLLFLMVLLILRNTGQVFWDSKFLNWGLSKVFLMIRLGGVFFYFFIFFWKTIEIKCCFHYNLSRIRTITGSFIEECIRNKDLDDRGAPCYWVSVLLGPLSWERKEISVCCQSVYIYISINISIHNFISVLS